MAYEHRVESVASIFVIFTMVLAGVFIAPVQAMAQSITMEQLFSVEAENPEAVALVSQGPVSVKLGAKTLTMNVAVWNPQTADSATKNYIKDAYDKLPDSAFEIEGSDLKAPTAQGMFYELSLPDGDSWENAYNIKWLTIDNLKVRVNGNGDTPHYMADGTTTIGDQTFHIRSFGVVGTDKLHLPETLHLLTHSSVKYPERLSGREMARMFKAMAKDATGKDGLTDTIINKMPFFSTIGDDAGPRLEIKINPGKAHWISISPGETGLRVAGEVIGSVTKAVIHPLNGISVAGDLDKTIRTRYFDIPDNGSTVSLKVAAGHETEPYLLITPGDGMEIYGQTPLSFAMALYRTKARVEIVLQDGDVPKATMRGTTKAFSLGLKKLSDLKNVTYDTVSLDVEGFKEWFAANVEDLGAPYLGYLKGYDDTARNVKTNREMNEGLFYSLFNERLTYLSGANNRLVIDENNRQEELTDAKEIREKMENSDERASGILGGTDYCPPFPKELNSTCEAVVLAAAATPLIISAIRQSKLNRIDRAIENMDIQASDLPGYIPIHLDPKLNIYHADWMYELLNSVKTKISYQNPELADELWSAIRTFLRNRAQSAIMDYQAHATEEMAFVGNYALMELKLSLNGKAFVALFPIVFHDWDYTKKKLLPYLAANMMYSRAATILDKASIDKYPYQFLFKLTEQIMKAPPRGGSKDIRALALIDEMVGKLPDTAFWDGDRLNTSNKIHAYELTVKLYKEAELLLAIKEKYANDMFPEAPVVEAYPEGEVQLKHKTTDWCVSHKMEATEAQPVKVEECAGGAYKRQRFHYERVREFSDYHFLKTVNSGYCLGTQEAENAVVDSKVLQMQCHIREGKIGWKTEPHENRAGLYRLKYATKPDLCMHFAGTKNNGQFVLKKCTDFGKNQLFALQ